MEVTDENGIVISNTGFKSVNPERKYSYKIHKGFKQKEGHCCKCDILLSRHPGKDGYCDECYIKYGKQ